MKIARYAVAALGLIALLTPTAKADTFVYQSYIHYQKSR
jgi:hypothetical protein